MGHYFTGSGLGNLKKPYVRYVLALIVLIGCMLLLTPRASAAPNETPDPGFFSAGNDIYIVASNDGPTNFLDAEISRVLAYFNGPSGNSITINNGRDRCGTPGNGTGSDGNDFAFTTFTFYNVTDTGDYWIAHTDNFFLTCGDVTIPVANLAPYTIPGTTDKRYVVRVVVTNHTNDSINAFKLRMPPGKGAFSYYNASGDKFALQDRVKWSPSPGSNSDFSLPFAPDCTVTSNKVVTLRWFDDDFNATNQNPGLGMELYEDGALVGTYGGFTGEGTPGAWNITVKPNKKYIWRWKNVTERNGIQFQLPFDSFYYNYTCQPPPSLSCDSVTVNAPTPEAGVNFMSTVNIKNAPNAVTYTGGTAKMTITTLGGAGSVTAGNNQTRPVPDIPGGGTGSASSANNITATPGRYRATWIINGGNATNLPLSCIHDFTVVALPYFRVYGGDVLAGAGGFGDPCPPPGSGTVRGFNMGDGAGSGAQLAVLAMSAIQEFSSATGRAAPTAPPRGLSFANTNPVYGGNFGYAPCPPDYFNNPNRPATTTPGGTVGGPFSTRGVSSLSSGSGINYHAGTPLRLEGGGGNTVASAGQKVILYVDGDVLINTDIKYNPVNWTSDSIPSFYLVVKGNIYIDKNVKQLDGVYVAQPNGASGGNIYTCAQGFAVPPVSGLLGPVFHVTCDNEQLRVNGSFIAQRIHLLRTVGTLRNSSNGEPASSGTIAEVFNFGPETWLGSQGAGFPKGGADDYNAITSLPPVL